jgi:hypothetical protein
MEARGSYQQAHLGRRVYDRGQRLWGAKQGSDNRRAQHLGRIQWNLWGKPARGNKAGVWGSFYRWGNDEPRGRGGLTSAASGGE